MIAFIYHGRPHPVHEAWMKSVTDELHSSLPRGFESYSSKSPLLHQPLSVLNAKSIPRADVYVIEGVVTLFAVLLRKKKTSKIILINADPFFHDLKKSGKIKRWISKCLIKKIDGIISVTNYAKKFAEEYTGVPQMVVHPWVDVKRFGRISPDFNSNGVCSILALNEQKGIDVSVNAFKIFKERYTDAKYFICGEGNLRKNVSKVDGVVAPGFCPRPEEYLEKAAIYVNAARYEPSGTNVIEAMAAGFAPIVSENVGFKELLYKVSDKLIVPLHAKKIAERIIWLRENKKINKKLGLKCKKIAIKMSKENGVKEFKKKFAMLLKRISTQEDQIKSK